MNLVALPAFTDNYIWMLHDGVQAVVVDPGDAAPVTTALDAQGLVLAGILVTHHHPDHVGGLAALAPRLAGPVWGPADEAITGLTQRVRDGDTVTLPGAQARVIAVPGHTAGHVAYHLAPADEEPGILFCGDTLFSAGCGRLFEGSPAQMHQSLQRLAALPDDTRVCCAHEYTESNLRFAAAVEPGQPDILAHQQHCQALRARGLPTLPSTLGLERRINPFLRCGQPAVIAAAKAQGAADDLGPSVLGALRDWKNRFR